MSAELSPAVAAAYEHCEELTRGDLAAIVLGGFRP